MPPLIPVDAIPFILGAGVTPPPVATGATAGTPGGWVPADATAPANFAALTGLVAYPSTGWQYGEHVRLANGTTAHWNGTAWAVGVAGSTSTTGRLPTDFATPGWAPEWMTGRDETYTTTQIDQIARERDVLVPIDGKFTAHLARLRSVNPSIQVLIYQLGPFASIGEAGATAAASWPEEEFAHTGATIVPPAWDLIAEDLAAPGARHGHADFGTGNAARIAAFREHKGNRIMTNEPFETFLMDAGNLAWRSRAAERALQAANQRGYHGVLLDSMGQGAMRVGYVDGAAWNRAAGAPYSQADWNAASAAQVRAVRAIAPNFVVAINGLGDSNAYAQTKIIGYEADLAMAERTLRDPDEPITAFPSTAGLKASIDMIVDMEANNKVGGGFATCTKLWTTPQPTAAQQTQWYEYCQAYFYCGTNGKSRFFFIKDGGAPAATGGAGGSHLATQPTPVLPNIGTPLAPYVQSGGLFTRGYSGGFVAVNSGTANATVTLPAGSFVRTDTGAAVSGTLSLGSNRGVTLVGTTTAKTTIGKIGWVDDGAYAGSRQGTLTTQIGPTTTWASSTLRIPPTWAIQNAGMRECVLNVGLNELVTVTASGTTYKAGSLEAKIAAATNWNNQNPQKLKVSVRLHVGDRAPAYWHTTCGQVQVTDANFGKIGWVPRWWVPAYRTLYSAAMAALAPIVDGLAIVNTINAPGAAFFYPEPFLKFPTSTVTTGVTVGDNLIAAGYTEAADRSFNLWFPTAHSVFTKTVVELALNPAGFVSSTGGSTAVDASHYQAVANALISAMPAGHAQLANYSAREDYMTGTGTYQTMYDFMATKNTVAFTGVQMARPHQVAQTSPDTREMWDEVAAWAEGKGFHFVETTGPTARPLDGSEGEPGLANIWPTSYEDNAAAMATLGTAFAANPRPTVA